MINKMIAETKRPMATLKELQQYLVNTAQSLNVTTTGCIFHVGSVGHMQELLLTKSVICTSASVRLSFFLVAKCNWCENRLQHRVGLSETDNESPNGAQLSLLSMQTCCLATSSVGASWNPKAAGWAHSSSWGFRICAQCCRLRWWWEGELHAVNPVVTFWRKIDI